MESGSDRQRILNRALVAIRNESSDSYDEEVFNLADEVLRAYGDEVDLADDLYRDLSPKSDWKLLAELIDILIWSTRDNGHELTKTTNRWIAELEDAHKIQIGMSLCAYPLGGGQAMISGLRDVAMRFPDLSEICDRWNESWHKHEQSTKVSGDEA